MSSLATQDARPPAPKTTFAVNPSGLVQLSVGEAACEAGCSTDLCSSCLRRWHDNTANMRRSEQMRTLVCKSCIGIWYHGILNCTLWYIVVYCGSVHCILLDQCRILSLRPKAGAFAPNCDFAVQWRWPTNLKHVVISTLWKLNIAIGNCHLYSGISHQKWWVSATMLNYERVTSYRHNHWFSLGKQYMLNYCHLLPGNSSPPLEPTPWISGQTHDLYGFRGFCNQIQ